MQRQLVNWLSDADMLPHLVPSAKIFTFTWDSNYYNNAPVVRIQDVADTLLRKLQDERDKVQSKRFDEPSDEPSDLRYRRKRTRGRSFS